MSIRESVTDQSSVTPTSYAPCLLCQQPRASIWWEPVSAQGERRQTLHCTDECCAAFNIPMRPNATLEQLQARIDDKRALYERKRRGMR